MLPDPGQLWLTLVAAWIRSSKGWTWGRNWKTQEKEENGTLGKGPG